MTRIRFNSGTALNVPNINDLNNVVISPTKPTTGEEVWIQKGKNLLSGIIENYTLDGNGGVRPYKGAYITRFIEVKPNTSYVSSGSINLHKDWYDENFAFISATGDNPAISPSNAKYIRMNGNGTPVDIMLEQGDIATDYEAYIDKKIHTKNDNDVYDVFYDETNLEIYSTSEQRIGTWIDGKPLYKRVLFLTSPELNTSIYHGIENIEEIVDIAGSINIAGEYKPITSVYVDNDNIYGRFSFSIYRFTVDFIYFSAGSYFTENKNNLKVRVIAKYTKTTD